MNTFTPKPTIGRIVMIAAMAATLLPAIVVGTNLVDTNPETGEFTGTIDVVVFGANGNATTLRSSVPIYDESNPNVISWKWPEIAGLQAVAAPLQPISDAEEGYGGFNPLSLIASFGLDQILAFTLTSFYLSNRSKITEAAEHIIAPEKLAGIIGARLGIHDDSALQAIEGQLSSLAAALSGTLIAIGDAKVASN